MDINQILSPGCVYCDASQTSKKRALEFIAELITQYHPIIDNHELFSALITREKMGSTGCGEGIAIPHCRLEQCQEPMGALLKLAEPIAFDSLDKKPVDLIFALIVPKEAAQVHLEILKNLAYRLDQKAYRESLRQALNHQELYLAATKSIRGSKLQ